MFEARFLETCEPPGTFFCKSRIITNVYDNDLGMADSTRAHLEDAVSDSHNCRGGLVLHFAIGQILKQHFRKEHAGESEAKVTAGNDKQGQADDHKFM